MAKNIFLKPQTLPEKEPRSFISNGVQSRDDELGAPPTATARPHTELDLRAPSSGHVTKLLEPFKGKSVGQCYQGPAWVDETGLAWVIVLAQSSAWPRAVRQSQHAVFLTWRWNNSPSVPTSLTAVVPGQKLSKPYPRWFGGSTEPVMAAIRKTSRFMVMLAHPDGIRSGWLLAEYPLVDRLGHHSLERHFTHIPTPGIRGTQKGIRYSEEHKLGGDRLNEIPLWREPRSDFWAALSYHGPWTTDLQHVDHLQSRWGSRKLRKRELAAGAIELLRDRYACDGEQPCFNADGTPTQRLQGAAFDGLLRAAKEYPLWAKFAASVAGPAPNAEASYLAAIECIGEPQNCWGLIALWHRELPSIDDDHLFPAIKMFTECALLSPEVTREGLLKPWFANSPKGLVLKTIPLDLASPIEDVATYWQQGLELHEIIDGGLWARGSDMPYPLAELGRKMAGTTIDGELEAAEERTMALLEEALAARQWSIPWGACIELAVGPFVGLRMYEVCGEFTCVFFDDRDRYYPVAIGLMHQRPQFCSGRFPKLSPNAATDDIAASQAEDWQWDDESQVTLQLIAAAIVRDFLVVEARESIFTAQNAKRRTRGRAERTIVYLPRVRYERTRVIEAKDSNLLTPLGRSRHSVAHHLRKASTPSAAQRFLALRYGVHVPEGFTFVRPHVRGVATEQERVRIYRSRSASQMLFEVVENAPYGTRPAWFDFEKDCAKLLRKRNLVVQHQAIHRDGDSGVDLYAVDPHGHGWVVQCKCWAQHRPVGPETIRELHGAIAMADAGSSAVSHGLVITTSRLTSGAMDLAKAFGYEWIDGDSFAKESQLLNL